MKYSELENVSPEDFKRLTGVCRKVFELMLEAVTAYKERPRKYLGRGRKPYKLTVADCMLVFCRIAGSTGSSCHRQGLRYQRDALLADGNGDREGASVFWKVQLARQEFSFRRWVLWGGRSGRHGTPCGTPKEKAETVLFWKKEASHYEDAGGDRWVGPDNLHTH